MMEHDHIADRIGIALVLGGLVLASLAVGAVALDSGTQQATDAPDGLEDDRTAALVFPIDNFSATPGQSVDASTQCLDGTTQFGFPIDNFSTAPGQSVDPSTQCPARGGTLAFPIDNFSATPGQSVDAQTLSLDQDMDPYAVSQDMDPYAVSQDMDPYASGDTETDQEGTARF